jgi:hypothetical protein
MCSTRVMHGSAVTCIKRTRSPQLRVRFFHLTSSRFRSAAEHRVYFRLSRQCGPALKGLALSPLNSWLIEKAGFCGHPVRLWVPCNNGRSLCSKGRMRIACRGLAAEFGGVRSRAFAPCRLRHQAGNSDKRDAQDILIGARGWHV